ncbi:MAG TPA: hypothetical protein VGE02_13475 [Gemmatimonadales bacterium]
MRQAGFALACTLVACLAATGCRAPTVPGEAPAYDPTTLTGGVLFAWPLGRAISVYVQGESRSPDPALAAAVDRALAAWEGAPRYGELRLRRVDDVRRADVVVRAIGAAPLVDESACGGGIGEGAGFTVLCASGDTARTLPLLDGGTSRVKVSVVVDPGAMGGSLDALVAHEMGHALGVTGHSADAGDVMHVSPAVSRPSARDGRTLRYVLHQPADVRL